MVGEGAAVLPLPGAPGLLCSFWGLTDYVSPQTQRSKAKVPPREMVVPDAPPPSTSANHRVAAALGQSDAAVPSARRLSPRGYCSANPLGLSLEFGAGPHLEEVKFSSVLQVAGYVYTCFREQLKGSYVFAEAHTCRSLYQPQT